MTLEDPFYVVKDEVFRALNKTRGLYLRWQELSNSPILPNTAEVEWTSIELRNALRSIEWDLEDLEDTISIAEKNSSKFKIDNKEICDRRSFIEATKQEVKLMKNKMSINKNRDSDGTAREPLLRDGSPTSFRNTNMWTPKYSQYSKLASQTDSPTRFDNFDNDMLQDSMIMSQDEQLAMINNSVGSLKTVSTHIGLELDEQAMMLDDLNSELENADSKLYTTVVKISKVLHINNASKGACGQPDVKWSPPPMNASITKSAADVLSTVKNGVAKIVFFNGRQWLAIVLLLCILVVILVLFIIL